MALALALASVWVSASNDTPPNSSSTFPTNHQITRLGRRPKISQSFPFMPLGSNLQARPRPINTYVSSDLFNGKAISAVRAGDLGGQERGFHTLTLGRILLPGVVAVEIPMWQNNEEAPARRVEQMVCVVVVVASHHRGRAGNRPTWGKILDLMGLTASVQLKNDGFSCLGPRTTGGPQPSVRPPGNFIRVTGRYQRRAKGTRGWSEERAPDTRLER